MTLDEAIQECIKDAQRITEGYYDDDGNWCHDPEIGNKCIQVAEWLRELKELRENEELKDVFKNCETCKYLKLDSDDYPCDRCMHRYINQYVYDDKREVNADDK